MTSSKFGLLRRQSSLRALLSIAAVLLAATLCVPSAYSAAPVRASAVPRPDGGTIIPDSDGRIAELLLQYHPELKDDLDLTYRDLFAALADDVHLRVLCPTEEAAQEFLAQWGSQAARGGRDVDVVDVGVPISIWARDRCIARQPRSLSRRAASFVPALTDVDDEQRRNDVRVQSVLGSGGIGPDVFTSPLIIEGGNVVSNSRLAFVGANVIDENVHIDSRTRLFEELRRVIGRPFMLVGDRAGNVPWCHVDMYLTPLDDKVVLVASPALGRTLLNRDLDTYGPSADTLWWMDACSNGYLDDVFDDVADRLTQRGYNVVRIPALVDNDENWMVTFNNVLTERREGRRIVYMPVYGLPTLDTAAEAIYRSLRCEVRTVDVSGIFTLGGALRCVANVTERLPARTLRSHLTRRGSSAVRYFRVETAEESEPEAIGPMEPESARDPVLESPGT